MVNILRYFLELIKCNLFKKKSSTKFYFINDLGQIVKKDIEVINTMHKLLENGTQYVFPRNPIKQEWMIENIINL